MARTASILTLARKLESARANLAAAVTAKQRELAQLDAALQRVLGGGGGTSTGNPRARANGRVGRRPGRRRRGGGLRKGSLGSVIVEVLGASNGKPSTIEAVLKGAKAKGYRSSAKAATQKIMVNAMLSKLVRTGMAKKAGRGLYAKA